MRDLTVKAWRANKEKGNLTRGAGERVEEGTVYLKLDGKIDLETVSAIADLEHVTGLCDLRLATRVFLIWEYKGTNSDILHLLNLEIREYRSLQIPVPNFNGEGFVLHHARCTGLGEFQGQQRSDWIWVRRHPASD